MSDDNNITLLKALQGAVYSPLESNYGIGAQTIASSLPALQNPYDSPLKNLGTTVGSGLFAGLLTGMARRDAAQENQRLIPLTSQIMAAETPEERMSLAAGEPRVMSLVQALGMQDYESDQKARDARRQKEIEYEYAPKIETAKFKAKAPLERNQAIDNKLIDSGFEQGLALDPEKNKFIPLKNLGLQNPQEFEREQLVADKIAEDNALRGLDSPNAPDYKMLQDKIATERQLETDFQNRAKTLKYKEQGLKALEQAYNDTEGTSDFELIRRAAQMVEPGLAVRRDDEQSLENAASALGMASAKLENAFYGKSKLEAGVREGMLRIAQRSYDSELADYNLNRESFLNRAKEYNLNEKSIVPYDAARPFAELYPELNQKIGIAGTQAAPPQSAALAELKRRGLVP